jgi:hypothetical protein
LRACGDDALDGGVSVRATLEPLSGAVRRPVDAIVIDNIPSQANRVEAALQRIAPEVGMPEVVLDLAPAGALPSHVPASRSISPGVSSTSGVWVSLGLLSLAWLRYSRGRVSVDLAALKLEPQPERAAPDAAAIST